MPNFSVLSAVPIGGVVANAFAGSAFEFLGRNSRVTIAATTALAAVGEVTATIQYGAEVQLEEGAINGERDGIGSGPRMPDDILVDDVGAAGDRLVMRLTSTGAGINNVRIKARIIPL